MATDRWQTVTDFEITKGMSTAVPSSSHPPHTHPPTSSHPTTNPPLPPTENLTHLSQHCSEFLIHAADNEGLQAGIDERLIITLASFNLSIPVTYAGGGRNLSDLDRVKELSGGKVDLTLGSCLDVFGGSGCQFGECVAWNRAQERD